MDGRVALITGSAKGLGRAFSEALIKKGAKVCICDILTEVGQHTAQELGNQYGKDHVTFKRCDVTSPSDMEDAIRHTVKTFGGLDIFCNNAGIGLDDPMQRIVDINVTAVIRGTLLSLDEMDKTKGGRGGVIINVASVSGLIPTKYEVGYVSTKHAVVGFSRALGMLTPRRNGVRVNCLCPTYVDTDMLPDKDSPDIRKWMTETIGIMTPEEVAEQFLRLVEDETLSGAVLLATANRKEVLRLPITAPEMFTACKM